MRCGLQGVITALVTPFLDGKLDERSLRRLLQSQVADGADGFVINGTTGESPTLQYDEIERIFEIAKEETNGEIPILLGTGSNCTRRTVEMTKAASRMGADAALVVTPYYNKPPQRGLVAHFKTVADSCALPLVLYNVPGRTITSLEARTVVELAQHPRIVGIKEASGDMAYFENLKAQLPDDFVLLSGDDLSSVEFCRRGGHGVIAVASHILMMEMKNCIRQARQGLPGAEEEFKKYGSLVRALYTESNPIPVKAAVYLRGLIDSAEMRLPLTTLSEEHLVNLRDEMQKFGKIGV